MVDPAGREMVISCGAALFNARLAVRHLGFTPQSGAPPGGRRRDGLAPGAYPVPADGQGFLSRDSGAEAPWRTRHRAAGLDTDPEVAPGVVGTVAVLTTRQDRRTDWLLAGQALQHVLLHAATLEVSAAFHTQPLELPHLRAAVRRDLVCGHPQMVLRLGHAARPLRSRRRPVGDVLSGD
ncbi:hypothetical protein [Actinomadura madurae]|nr:hypothetical protein [Actinomadura madurae]MCP9984904.1 hypothetical protein [Actinomadura madurae]